VPTLDRLMVTVVRFPFHPATPRLEHLGSSVFSPGAALLRLLGVLESWLAVVAVVLELALHCRQEALLILPQLVAESLLQVERTTCTVVEALTLSALTLVVGTRQRAAVFACKQVHQLKELLGRLTWLVVLLKVAKAPALHCLLATTCSGTVVLFRFLLDRVLLPMQQAVPCRLNLVQAVGKRRVEHCLCRVAKERLLVQLI
jgi:hypothetical protein